jgi:hypothetical protein
LWANRHLVRFSSNTSVSPESSFISNLIIRT